MEIGKEVNCYYCDKPFYSVGYDYNNTDAAMRAETVAFCEEHFNASIEWQRNKELDFIKNEIIKNSGIPSDALNYTLDNYDPLNDSQAKLWQQLRSLVENYPNSMTYFFQEKPIILIAGKSGLGKTHLSSATCIELINKGLKYVKYIDFKEIKLELRSNYQRGFEIANEIKSKSLIVIDEFSVDDITPTIFEVIQVVLYHRIENRKGTILVTNQGIADIADNIGVRLRSRFHQFCKPYVITGDDFRRKGKNHE